MHASLLDADKMLPELDAALISASKVFYVPTIIASSSALLLLNRGGVSLCDPLSYVLQFLVHSEQTGLLFYCGTHSFQIFPDLGDGCADGDILYVYKPETKV